MQTNNPPIRHDFGGHFNSNGGPQLIGNEINTNGGPINIGVNTNDELPVKICELPNFLLTPSFTGRGDELQQIDRAFSIPSDNLPQRCIIHGMPGVGKTQLALKFATLAFQKGQYSYVFWVSGESVEKLSQDVSRAVDLLCLPGRYTLNQAGKMTAARRWLENSTVAGSWLVVLDNVSEETATTTLRDFLPRENCKGRILITTRVATVTERYTASEGSPQLALQPPGTDDAVKMLSIVARLEREGKEAATFTDAERLVRSVGNLPLAIDQAASYMRETGCSSQEVLNIYKSDEVLEMLSWENDLSRYEEKSVVATFTPALNRIQETAPDAVTLLRLLCFCDPEGIPISIFQQGCDALQEEQNRSSQARTLDKAESIYGFRQSLKGAFSALRQKSRHAPVEIQGNDKLEAIRDLFRSSVRLSKAIQELQRLSLAAQALEGTERIIRIHDLVHLLLRSKLMTDTERKEWLEIAINIVCKVFNEIGDVESPQNWSRYSRSISHIESLDGFAQKYMVDNIALLDASSWAAGYLDECGLYEKAAILYKRTLSRQKRILGERHPDTLMGMNNLALSLQNLGKYEEAEVIHREGLALCESVLGKEHPSTLMSMSNLALALRSLGKYEEAEGLSQYALALKESVLGKEHPDTLVSVDGLASTYWQQDRWKEAEGLEVRVMETRKRILGNEHPQTFESMYNLAITWKSQGCNEEAVRLMKDCLELENRILGPQHPHTERSVEALRIWEGREAEVEDSA